MRIRTREGSLLRLSMTMALPGTLGDMSSSRTTSYFDHLMDDLLVMSGWNICGSPGYGFGIASFLIRFRTTFTCCLAMISGNVIQGLIDVDEGRNVVPGQLPRMD